MGTGCSRRAVHWHRAVRAVGSILLLLGWLLPRARPGTVVWAAGGTEAPPPCHAADLDAAVGHGGVTDYLWLRVALTTIDPATTCALTAGLELQVRDAADRLLIAAPIPGA